MPKPNPAPNRVRSMRELRETADATTAPVFSSASGQRLTMIPFAHIRPFKGHPFRLYTGERLADMVESIRQNGILLPLIVRRIFDDPDYEYEMLAGHNRMNAGKLAGLEAALCLVKENLSDNDARMYVIETNLMQRSFKDLLPSEKAAVLAMRYSEMFSQGKRNDIIRELCALEGGDETCGTEFHKSKSRDAIGQEYELTGRMVAKYVRLDGLIEPLKLRLDNGEFVINTGVSLSYLDAEAQAAVEIAMAQSGVKLSEPKAAELRSAAGCDAEAIAAILAGAQTDRTDKPRKISVGYDTYGKYFTPNTPKQEIQKSIALALELYFSAQRGDKEDMAV